MFDKAKRIEKVKKFLDNAVEKHGSCGILAPATPAQEALDEIIVHLLGDKWCVLYSCSTEQANTEAVCEIIEAYKRKQIYNR